MVNCCDVSKGSALMKMARRFYVPGNFREFQTVVIEGREARHIERVLRMKPGDGLLILDGLGSQYQGEIKEVSAGRVIVTILAKEECSPEPPVRVVLAQGIPKGDKLEFIIQKGTELGLARLVPLLTPRSVIRPDREWVKNRTARWERVAAEAVKQCRRSVLPEIDTVRSLEQALGLIPQPALAIIPWEGEGEVWLKDLLQREGERASEVWIFIGPEGGWEQREVELAREAGVIPVTLGPRILRTETAALTLLSILMYEWGDVGERRRDNGNE